MTWAFVAVVAVVLAVLWDIGGAIIFAVVAALVVYVLQSWLGGDLIGSFFSEEQEGVDYGGPGGYGGAGPIDGCWDAEKVRVVELGDPDYFTADKVKEQPTSYYAYDDSLPKKVKRVRLDDPDYFTARKVRIVTTSGYDPDYDSVFAEKVRFCE